MISVLLDLKLNQNFYKGVLEIHFYFLIDLIVR